MIKRYIMWEINGDTLTEFTWFVNTTDEKDSLEIILDSTGWEVITSQVIIDMINSDERFKWIKIMKAESAAFDIMMEVNIPITIFKGSFWMVHKWSWSIPVKDWWDIQGEFAKFAYAQQLSESMDTSFLLRPEREIFNEWRNVYLDSDRLKEIIDNKKARD